MSGSCSLKTCWKTLPYFKSISNYLMDKYVQADAVTATSIPESRKRNLFNNFSLRSYVLHSANSLHRSPKSSELVFLEPSPNYCEKDVTAGSLGTVGRICNRSTHGKILIELYFIPIHYINS